MTAERGCDPASLVPAMTDRETADLRSRRLRTAVANLDPETVKGTFASLNPSVIGQLHPALRTSLGRLRSARDPLSLLALPHFELALEYVAQVVTVDCLDAAREALGGAADDPTLEQLQAALQQISDHFTPDIVAVLLAVTAVVDAPAAGVCDELLATAPTYGLRIEDLPEESAAPAPPPTPVARRSPAPRTAKGKKKGGRVTPSQKAHKPWKAGRVGDGNVGSTGVAGEAGRAGGSQGRAGRRRGEAGEASDTAEPPAAGLPGARSPIGGRTLAEVAGGRRPAQLTPKQAAEFDPDDAWAGAVVLAEIRYRSADEGSAHFGAKERPCVVIAGNDTALLVRPGYTGRYQQGNWRSVPLKKWHQAGLNRETWIEHDVHEVGRSHASLIGRVADDDWNALW